MKKNPPLASAKITFTPINKQSELMKATQTFVPLNITDLKTPLKNNDEFPKDENRENLSFNNLQNANFNDLKLLLMNAYQMIDVLQQNNPKPTLCSIETQTKKSYLEKKYIPKKRTEKSVMNDDLTDNTEVIINDDFKSEIEDKKSEPEIDDPNYLNHLPAKLYENHIKYDSPKESQHNLFSFNASGVNHFYERMKEISICLHNIEDQLDSDDYKIL